MSTTGQAVRRVDSFDDLEFFGPPQSKHRAVTPLVINASISALIGDLEARHTPCLSPERAALVPRTALVVVTNDVPASVAWRAAAAGCLLLLEPAALPELTYTTNYVEQPVCFLRIPALDRGRDLATDIIVGIIQGQARLDTMAEMLRRYAYSHHAASRQNRTDVLTALAAAVPEVNDNYMWPGERELIAHYAKGLPPGAIVELGVGSGGTLAVLAAHADRDVLGIDNFSYGGVEQRTTVLAVAAKIGNIEIREATLREAAWHDPIAFLHVDAGHDYVDCLHDLETFAPHVVPAGVLAVDDYNTHIDQPEVRRATDEFIARGGWTPLALGPKLALWRRMESEAL